MDFGVDGGKALHELADLVDPGVVDVECDAANAGVTGVESLSRRCFDDVVNQFALLEEVQERGKSTEIQRTGARVEQVILDSH